MNIFAHDVERHLPICISCKYAVLPRSIGDHLRDKHKGLQLERSKRQEIQDRVVSWTDVILKDIELVHLKFPSKGYPVEHLHVYKDGLACDSCNYLCRNEKGMQMHCRDEHGWINPRGRKRAKLNHDAKVHSIKPWREVACQRFFPSGLYQQYFEVSLREHESQSEQNSHELEGQTVDWQQARLRLSTAMSDLEKQMKIPSGRSLGPRDASPWLTRTGWLVHFKGLAWAELHPLLAKPSEKDQPVGHRMWKTVEQVIEASHDTVGNEAPGTYMRLEALRLDQASRKGMPLVHYQDVSFLLKNAFYWCQVVEFFFHCETADKVPKFKFTRAQRSAWQAFKLDAQKQEQPGNEPECPGLTRIQRSCLSFCISLLDDRARYNPYECALVVASAVFGATKQGWRGPETYTPILSGIIKLARMMLIQHVMIETGYDGDEDDASVRSLGDPWRRPPHWRACFLAQIQHSPITLEPGKCRGEAAGLLSLDTVDLMVYGHPLVDLLFHVSRVDEAAGGGDDRKAHDEWHMLYLWGPDNV